MPRQDLAEVAEPLDLNQVLLAAESVCEQRLRKVQRGRLCRRRAGLDADGVVAIKEDRAQYILDNLTRARWLVANEMVPLEESKEAVGFFSLFFAIVGFCVGALANSDAVQAAVSGWFL